MQFLVNARDQTSAFLAGGQFAQITTVGAVDVGPRETANFESVSGKERISEPISNADAVPTPQPARLRANCFTGHLRTFGRHIQLNRRGGRTSRRRVLLY